MRKAAAGLGRKATSRRRQAQEQQLASKQEDMTPSPSNEHKQPKPMNDEQALTAKNYRLAKELSELRVRHREETKNVTRLTMENMNLASRCREAISHVAMLKKEMAMHQRRSAEALAAQRQALQRKPSSDADAAMTSELALEMDRIDRIMAAHSPHPAPPVLTVTSTSTSNTKSKTEKTSSTVADDSNEDEANKREGTPSPSEDEEGEEEFEVPSEQLMLASLSRVIFPHSPSSQLKNDVYNESFPADLPPRRLLNPHFTTSPILLETDNDDRSCTSAMSDDRSSFSIQSNMSRAGTSSSMDAFEASFNTSFPTSFASNKNESMANIAQKPIYNPFAPSPTRNAKIRDEIEGSRFGIRDRSPEEERVESTAAPKQATLDTDTNEIPRAVHTPIKPGGEHDEKPPLNPSVSVRNTTTQSQTAQRSASAPSRNDGDSSSTTAIGSQAASSRLFPRSSPQPPQVTDPDPSEPTHSTGKQDLLGIRNQLAEQGFSSPMKSLSRTESLSPETNSPDRGQPRRPEKTSSASARARYEKALQPRSFTGASSVRSVGRLGAKTRLLNSEGQEEEPTEKVEDEREVQPAAHPVDLSASVGASKSPSLVLKRLQERKVKEKLANDEVKGKIANDERTSNANETGATTSTSSDTSSVSTNVDQLSVSGSTASRAENRKRLVALRVVAKGTNDLSTTTPVDEGHVRSRSSSVRDFSSHRNGDHGDEIMADSDNSSQVSSKSLRNLRTYGIATESPVMATRKLFETNKVSDTPVQFGRPSYVPSATSESAVSSGKYAFGPIMSSEYAHKLSPDSMMKESYALDAMATTSASARVTSPPLNADAAATRFSLAGKLRRAVKQPISYAEPTLNSKLRRGDVYFEKGHENSSGLAPPQGVD